MSFIFIYLQSPFTAGHNVILQTERRRYVKLVSVPRFRVKLVRYTVLYCDGGVFNFNSR